tara:strand:- start:219 stop:404 length:186 start_codon:yes stop_codon:yes gene_type:complete
MVVVITVKLGLDKESNDAAAITMRDTNSGEVMSWQTSGSRQMIKQLFESFESNPNIMVKYE